MKKRNYPLLCLGLGIMLFVCSCDGGGAVGQPAMVFLDVKAMPAAYGSVTPSGKYWYNLNDEVTLTATANAGYEFSHWSGDVTDTGNTENPATIIMDKNKIITANFVGVPRYVTVTSARGEPDPPVGTTPYPNNSQVTVSCGTTPYPGPPGTRYECTGWEGGTGDIAADDVATLVTFIITQDCTITWTWQTQYYLETFVLPIWPVNGGTVLQSSDGWYDEGTSVQLTADPLSSDAFLFTEWSGDLTSANSPDSVTMDGPKTVTANFVVILNPHTITVASPHGAPNPSMGEHTCPDGYPATVSCGPNPYPPDAIGTRYVCTGWQGGSGNGIPATGTGTSYTISAPPGVTQDSTITWTWKTQYYLTTSVLPISPVVGGTVTPSAGWYDVGTVVSCNATANYGYHWVGWSGHLTGDTRPQNLTMNGPRSIIANFEGEPRSVTVFAPPSSSPDPPVGTTPYHYGDSVTVSCGLTPLSGPDAGSRYACTGWTDGTGDISPATGTGTSFGPFSISQNSTITWVWQTQYHLVVSINPPGSGTVTPAAGWYGAGTVFFSVSATANPGWRWVCWSGDLTGTENPISLTMDGPKAITGNFTPDTYDVTVSSAYGEPKPSGTTSYTGGSSVTVSCGPTPFYSTFGEGFEAGTLSGWTTGGDANWSATTDNKHSGTYSALSGAIADNQSTYIERTFTIGAGGGTLTFWWKVSSEPNGDYLRFYVDGQQQAEISGETVWAQITHRLAAGNRTLRWSYVKNASTAQNSDRGWIDDITVTDTPASRIRYVCTGWTGGSGDIPATGTGTSRTFTITRNCAITWTWKTQYQLTTAVNPPNGGSVTPTSGGWYDSGTVITCNATEAAGYGWVGWSGDPVVNPDDPLTPETVEITMNGPKSITANFVKPTLTVSNPAGCDTPRPAVGTYVYNYGTSVTCHVSTPVYAYLTPQFTEGFEAGNINGWTTTSGTTAWYAITPGYTGIYSARSGSAVGNNGESYIQRTFTVGAEGGTVAFWWKVSSEYNYDWLEFYIDNQLQTGRISGEVDWNEVTFPLEAGTRTLRWRFTKDISDTPPVGSNCGWVDDILVPTAASDTSTRYICTGYTGTGSCPTWTEGQPEDHVTFTIFADSSITWNWLIQHRLTVDVDPADSGLVPIVIVPQSGDGYYDEGTVVTLMANAGIGYVFAHWSGDLTGTDFVEYLTMDGPKDVTANFVGPNTVSNFTGTANSESAITWSWTSSNSDWQEVAGGVLRTMATTLQAFQTTNDDLPGNEACPRGGTGDERLLFEAADDLPDMLDVQDCPTVSAASAQTYTITYTRTDASHWTCTADTDRTDLNDYYIDETGALLEAPSTGDGPQANSSSPISPDNVWFEIQDSAHLALGTVYPNITSWQETTGLLENVQYTRHVHSVSYGVYSNPSNNASCYTRVHNATPDDFSLTLGGPTSSKTIGTGTTPVRYPIDIAYNYARCQMLYLASEIATAGQAATITRLRFQRASGDADTVNIVEIHMAHTTQPTLTSWQDTGSHTLVYGGNLSIPSGDAGSWFEIPLTTWFYYNGSNNLIISFRHQDGSSEATEYTQWRADNTKTGRCVAGYSNNVSENPPPVTGANIYLPNVGFEFAGTVTIEVTTLPPNSDVRSTGVRIERSRVSDFSSGVAGVQDYARPYTKTDVVASGEWFYRIGFRNADGIPSGYSDGRTITVP